LNIIQAYLGNPCENDVDPLLQVKKSIIQVVYLSCTKFSEMYFFYLPQVKKVKKVFSTITDVGNEFRKFSVCVVQVLEK